MSSPTVREVVLPVMSGIWTEQTFAYQSLSGSTFLIGPRGFALTAAHVVDQITLDSAAVGWAADRWVPLKIVAAEKHPTEDVAVLQLHMSVRPSWLAVSLKSEHQTCEYDSWGYPIAIAELPQRYEEGGLQNPELVYTRGYIRRRISQRHPISIYRGEAFYEISEVAGDGCSGGPVIDRRSLGRNRWQVIGIYIGAASAGFSAAYATRSDSFHNWAPTLLGCSILEESVK